MAITNGTGSFNTGRDCRIVLVGPFGQVTIPNVVKFGCKAEYADIKIDRLDGIQMQAHLPKGWTFEIEAERAGSGIDDLFGRIEAVWYDSGIIGVTTLYQYVDEPNLSSSTFQMDNVALKLDDAGSWEGDKSTKQRLSGMANRRRRV